MIIFFAANDGEILYSQQKQDWELTVAQIMNSLFITKFRLKWKKSRKNHSTIQVWPKSNLIWYTVEVTNTVKRLDLTDRMPEELWTEFHNIV